MKMKLVCLLVFIAVNSVNSQVYQACITPNQLNGFCQPVKTCASIVKMLQQPTPLQRVFLRNSQCKLDISPWVCCPDAPAPAPASASTAKGTLPKAPNCGIDSPDRIFGGEETKIDEYPWLVQLQYRKPGNRISSGCGGSLINQRYVLTAAHCISKIPADWTLVSVKLGEWDTKTNRDCDDSYANEVICNDPHVEVPVEQKIVHEDYLPNSKNQHHDIALLRLSKNVQYTDFIKPICLPLDSAIKNLDLSGLALDVAGWGKTESSSSSTRKLKVSVNAYSKQDCQQVYTRSNIQIIDNQLCAGGEPGRDSCNGDSGGPLMRYYERGTTPHYFLAGVVSYGPRNCGTPDIPGVYTRTSKYIEWIQANIRE